MSADAGPSESLTMPTLIVAISSTDPPSLIINMSLIEVAVAFDVSIGLAGNYLGSYAAGRLGVKRVIVTSSLLTGLLIVSYMGSLSLVLTLMALAVMSLTAGVVLTCTNTLLLSQAPAYRGTVTSLNSAATQLGIALGAAIGGATLGIYGWGAVCVAYGAMHILAAMVYQVGVREHEQIGHSLASIRIPISTIGAPSTQDSLA